MLGRIGLLLSVGFAAWGYERVAAVTAAEDVRVNLPAVLSPQHNPAGTYSVATLFRRGDDVVLSTSFVDWNRNGVFVLTLDKAQQARSCVVKDDYLDFEIAKPARTPISFSFMVRGSAVVTHYQSRSQQPAASDYSFPLAKAIAGSSIQQTAIDASFLRENIACEAGEFVVWYRMPAEAVFLGYPVRACLAVSDSGYKQWYTNMKGAEHAFGRLGQPANDSDSANGPEPTEQRSLASQYHAAFIDGQFESWAAELRRRFDIAFARYQNERSKELTEQEISQRERYILELMLETVRHFDNTLNDGHSLFLDPFVRGLMFEQTFWRPRQHRETMAHRIAAILDDLQARGGTLTHSLCCAYADLGFAPNGTSHAILANTVNGQYYQDRNAAAILARWRWPTEDRHVKAIAEHLRTARHITERFDCVETLFLMDEIDQVPDELLASWFQQRVIDAGQSRRPLNLLMQNHDGREFLANQCVSLTAGSALRNAIQELFANEIRAVHKTGDFRFFSKDECARITRQLRLDL